MTRVLAPHRLQLEQRRADRHRLRLQRQAPRLLRLVRALSGPAGQPLPAGSSRRRDLRRGFGLRQHVHALDQNATTGISFSTTQTVAGAALSSAEWVAEAPSRCSVTCTVLPLANFGTVNFSGSYATGNSHPGSISDAAWNNDQIQMVTQSLLVKAQPPALSPDGSAFSVTWKHN